MYSDLKEVQYSGNTLLYSAAKDEYIIPATLFKQLTSNDDFKTKISATAAYNPTMQSRQDIKQPINLQSELQMVRKYLWEKVGCPTVMTNIPIFDPKSMKELCVNAGAVHLFDEVMNVITIPGQSRETHEISAVRTVNLIHTMMYAQSQNCSWFQHTPT